jgi:hypothetical protein
MKKNKILYLLVAITLFSLFMVPAMAAPNSKIEPLELTKQKSNSFNKLTSNAKGLIDNTNSKVSVIVETTTHDYELVTKLVQSLGGTVNIEYNNINGVSVEIPACNLFTLANSPLISKIFKDEIREMNIAKGEIDTHLLMTDGRIEAVPLNIEEMEEYPATFSNFYLTDANAIWEETLYGYGAKVAIIDSGCWNETWIDPSGNPHSPWYWGAVYDGVDLSYDAGNSMYGGYGNPLNYYHGTACATLLAANTYLKFYNSTLPPYSPHPWGAAIANYVDGVSIDQENNQTIVPCYGIAPFASIYAVKVFDHTGAAVPSSIIMEGIDAAINAGVDVISMSLGGGVGAPGEDPSDLLVDAASEAGITVVVSAGNEGPSLLKVGSPGTAESAITVGAAQDPIHERVYGDIAYGPGVGRYYYPSDQNYIIDFSSRGPTSDGRNKPDVVATGSWTFFGYPPSEWPYTIALGSGTSFSCPQVAGEAALLINYAKSEGVGLEPSDIKKSIMEGAIPIEGYQDFEQGAGYINCVNSLEIVKAMVEEQKVIDSHHHGCKWKWNHHCGCQWNWNHHLGSWWFPPIETLKFHNGIAKVYDITLNPGMFKYFNFWVSKEVDSVRITLSDISYGEEQNELFVYDAGALYLSSAAREGIDDYFYWREYFYYYNEMEYEISSDSHFQPGVQRLVLAGDFSSYSPIHIEKMTIEIVNTQALKFGKYLGILNSGVDVKEAQVELFKGDITQEHGYIKEGESDFYSFTIPDLGHDQLAILELSWYRDWTKWATSDLDMIVFYPNGSVNVDGATGSSPEFVQITEPGEYLIMIDGYQIYFGKSECYSLEITYFFNIMGNWHSKIFTLDSWFTCVKLPNRKKGLAVLWLHSKTDYWDYWYIGDIVKL